MHEYGLTLHQALFKFPLAAAITLWPAIARRRGWVGPENNPITQARIEARDRVMKYLKEHYQILPDHTRPPHPSPTSNRPPAQLPGRSKS